MITRVGCKAMIVVKKMNSGKWMVSKFEKEHNHSLSHSKMAPIISNITSGEVDDFTAKGADPNDVKTEGCSAGGQCNPVDSLTVLYNNLCQEALKFAKEGSVTEEIYHVAVSALKEAAKKVAEVKRSCPLPHHDFISEIKHDVFQVQTMSTLQCSNQVELETTLSRSGALQESASNLLLVPTNVITDSRLYNCVNNVPLSSDFLTNGKYAMIMIINPMPFFNYCFIYNTFLFDQQGDKVGMKQKALLCILIRTWKRHLHENLR
jgi:hypothetical protein